MSSGRGASAGRGAAGETIYITGQLSLEPQAASDTPQTTETTSETTETAETTGTTDSANPLVVNRRIALEGVAGDIIAEAYSDSEGNYSIAAPGSLVIAGADTTAELTNNGTYYVTSLIDDNGEGKVLAVREEVTLTSDALEGSVLALGANVFEEISAIKGKVNFVNPDGSENTRIAKVGTDVYLPGFSYFAKTDHEGHFLILFVIPETYTLRIERDGFALEQSITVTEATTLNLGTVNISTDLDPPITTVSVDSTDFKNPLCLSFSASEADSRTFYSMDGSNPTVSDTFLYDPSITSVCGAEASCPVCVKSSSRTLKFFSVDPAGNAEDIKSTFYFYNTEWADPSDRTAPVTTVHFDGTSAGTGSTIAKESYEPVLVDFRTNEGADVYYTSATTGTASDPTLAASNPMEYINPFTVRESTSIKFYAKDYAGNLEPVKSMTIDIYNWKQVSNLPVILDQTRYHFMRYDPTSASLILVGKVNGESTTAVYQYNTSADSWTQLNSCTAGVNSCPHMGDYGAIANYAKTAALDYAARKLVMFYNDTTFMFSLATNTWDSQNVPANPDGTVYQMFYDANQNLLVTTGYNAGNIAYSLSYSNYTWSAITVNSSSSGPPETVKIASWTRTPAGFTIWGEVRGTTAAKIAYTSVFRFALGSSSAGTWTKTALTNYPNGIYSAVLSHDSDKSRYVLFGGGDAWGATDTQGLGNLFGETWILDSANAWTLADVQRKPIPRRRASMAYDPTAKKHVMVGGESHIIRTNNETWVFGK